MVGLIDGIPIPTFAEITGHLLKLYVSKIFELTVNEFPNVEGVLSLKIFRN